MTTAADSPSTDPSLLRMLGDPEIAHKVWVTFVREYRPVILKGCRQRNLQEDDVEEIYSRVILNLLQAFPEFKYDPIQRFRGYLMTVVLNALYSYWRERKRKPGNWSFGGVDGDEFPLEFTRFAEAFDRDASQRLELIERAIPRVRDRVQSKTWDCFWMLTVEGLSGREIAAQLGIQVANVYVYSERAKRMLLEEVTHIRGDQ